MLARDLISDSIPPVKITDPISVVMNWMSEFKVSQLPVLQGDKLEGIVHEDDLLDAPNEEMSLGELRFSTPEQTFVFEDNHLYEVASKMAQYKLDIMPVLDYKHQFLGIATQADVIEGLSRLLNVHEPGGIITLQVPVNSYHLSEISRICESNNAKVLSLSVKTMPNPTQLQVTLKLNLRELSRVIATFERFDYEIANVIFDSEQLDDYRENYEALLRYLNP